ncbi:YbdD/YjiX family protein [Streptomyces sp. NPDC005808]|uniref:YbdD/YjiX family protein n=1 Tax=Streptomyces sp. NPDC005808 TaxID=3364734 RepID=UPI0036AC336A
MRSVLHKAISGVRWYVRELTDESAYDRHIEHIREGHPSAAVPTRREFERMRTARRDKDPRQGFRCC